METTGSSEIQNENEFDCDLFYFNSKWENGLSIHMTKKHSKIDQLYGHSNINKEKYQKIKHDWETVCLGIL